MFLFKFIRNWIPYRFLHRRILILIFVSIFFYLISKKISKKNKDPIRDFFNELAVKQNIPVPEKIDVNALGKSVHAAAPFLPHPILFRPKNPKENRVRLILLATGFYQLRHWFYKPQDEKTDWIMEPVFCPLLQGFCNITTDLSKISQADALVFHGRNSFDRKVFESKRRANQKFVFALWSSPIETCDLKNFDSFFNWTMSYRLDSTIVSTYQSENPYIHVENPYYKKILEENLNENNKFEKQTFPSSLSSETLKKKKLGTMATIIPDCSQTGCLTIIKNLLPHVDVEIYGPCGKKCPENVDCLNYLAENYFFYFNCEQSLCTDYVTENFFSILKTPIVPVVFGRANYSKFLPASAFIDSRDFTDEVALAKFLNKTRHDLKKYSTFFDWKSNYVWLSSTFFYRFCDLCVRLHVDQKPSVIDDLHSWWFGKSCVSTLTSFHKKNEFSPKLKFNTTFKTDSKGSC